MNYEEKYKQALERAKRLYEQGTITESLGFVFPELKETDAERMKKAIKHILYENYTDAAVIEGVEIAEIVAWLEKQGKKLDADKVIEWMRVKAPKWLYDMTYPIRLDVDAEDLIKQFKKDFEI